MADFRKSLLLAAMALAVGVGTASAQSPSCNGTPAAVPTLRSEGQAELTGSIVLNCTNIAIGQLVNFDILLNGGKSRSPAVRRLSAKQRDGDPHCRTDRYLPGPVRVARTAAFVNDVRVTGVATPTPILQITISGIRANVNPDLCADQLPPASVSVLATISTSNGILPITEVERRLLRRYRAPGSRTDNRSAAGFSVQSCSGGVRSRPERPSRCRYP